MQHEMSEVSVQVRFDTIKMLQGLVEDSIQNAVQRTIARLRELATKYTPERSGRLLESFDIASTPRSIVMKWSATDPKSGFNYATVADVGRPGGALIEAKTPRGLRFKIEGRWIRKQRVVQGAMQGTYFSEAMKFEAREIMIEELTRELVLTRSVVT